MYFTDHMVRAVWTKSGGWGDGRVEPYGPIQLMPSAAVLHYAQEIFEGLKAYRHADGSVWSFRPEANAERMQRSARRLALPELPTDDFVASLRALVEVDEPWVPPAGTGETSLYLRPFMYASEAFLGVRPAERGHLLPHRLAGRGLLRRRPQAGDAVDLRSTTPAPAPAAPAPPRPAATTPRPSPASSRASSTAATRPSSSTPRRRPTSRSSAG